MKILPLIDFSSSFFDQEALKECYIIGVQHLLPTTLFMFRKLFKKGLKPENLSLLGKCYSTNMETYDAMKKEGLDICPSSINFDSHKSYDDQFNENVKNFLLTRLDRILNGGYKKVIIIDDGGHFIDELIHHIDETHTNIVGIEQTSSGYNILKNKQHKIPIVNLARAKTKLDLEPQKIIEKALSNAFEYIDEKGISIKKVLICGNGEIGQKVTALLGKKYEVFAYDIDESKSDFTRKELETNLNQFDLIIGCTGYTSISKELHQHFKEEVVLVSISSSDREFDAKYIRQRTSKTEEYNQHLNVDGIHLVNNGFPSNFRGQNVDNAYFFQLIRSLIIKCILQANKLKTEHKGFIDLNHESQQIVNDKFQFITRKRSVIGKVFRNELYLRKLFLLPRFGFAPLKLAFAVA